MTMRTLVAFAVAPIPAALYATWNIIKHKSDYREFVIFLMVSIVLFALQLIIGIPVYQILKRRRLLSASIFAISGFVSAGAIALLALSFSGPPSLGLGTAHFVLSCLAGLLGASIGIVFWLVARPDRSVLPLHE
jgi:hypothetical protein